MLRKDEKDTPLGHIVCKVLWNMIQVTIIKQKGF
jgi:hypothetical protein